MDITLEPTLTQFHPTLAALVWNAITRRIDVQDQQLAIRLKESDEWEELSPDHAQWVDMLIGGNLSSEATRNALINILIDEVAEL